MKQAGYEVRQDPLLDGPLEQFLTKSGQELTKPGMMELQLSHSPLFNHVKPADFARLFAQLRRGFRRTFAIGVAQRLDLELVNIRPTPGNLPRHRIFGACLQEDRIFLRQTGQLSGSKNVAGQNEIEDAFPVALSFKEGLLQKLSAKCRRFDRGTLLAYWRTETKRRSGEGGTRRCF